MASIHIADLNETVELPVGAPFTDLDGRLKFGCKAAACGSCALEIMEGAEFASPVTSKELRALDRLKLSGVRLACQMQVTGDCSIKKFKKQAEPLRSA